MDSAPRINSADSSAASYISRSMTFFRRIETDTPLSYQRNQKGKGFLKGEVEFLADFLCRHGSRFKKDKDGVFAQFLPDSRFQHPPDPFGIYTLTIDIFLFHEFRRLAHHPAYLLACEGGLNSAQLSFHLFRYGKRPQGTDQLGEAFYKLGETLSFAGGHPVQQAPFLCEAFIGKELAQKGNFPLRLDVAAYVMAIAGMTSEDHHTVETGEKGPGDKGRYDPAGAHHADDTGVGRILKARNAGQIGACICAPVAKEG